AADPRYRDMMPVLELQPTDQLRALAMPAPEPTELERLELEKERLGVEGARLSNAKASRDLAGGGEGGGLPSNLAAADKTRIEGFRTLEPMLEEYRGLVSEFLSMNPVQRARAISPLGSPEQQQLVGRISSLRESLSFGIKN